MRPKIMRTRPVIDTTDKSCEIHVLTSELDWLNLVWMLKSFYRFSSCSYSLAIHDDGTLLTTTKEQLRQHFPNARIIERNIADKVINEQLSRLPLSMAFREKNPLALKVYDFAFFLDSPRMLLLDSDILFFANPTELIRRIEDLSYRLSTLNKDWQVAYTVRPPEIQRYVDFPIVDQINSGLGLLHKDTVRFEAIEQYLRIPGVIGHHHQIEQTLIALACSEHGFEFLPNEYDVRVNDGNPDFPCRHYTGPIRHLMYKYGMRHLVKNGFFEHDRP